QSENSGDTSLIGRGQLVKAFVIRRHKGERHVLSYDLHDLERPGDHVSEAPIYPGDIVYVPETVNLAFVMGEVRNPGAFRISEGANLLNLLVLAGGPVEARGNLKQIVLLREIAPGKTEISLLDMRTILESGTIPEIKPGDIVYVPRKALVRASEFVQQVFSTISPILNLYRQAYDTYYTKDRYDAIGKSATGPDNALLTIEQVVRNIGAISSIASGI
ncbi:SLBB domain-containing protein, partial [Candidatus Hydrogenedentota bacterium]